MIECLFIASEWLFLTIWPGQTWQQEIQIDLWKYAQVLGKS